MAKLTILFFIAICFEIGILLTILPWLSTPSWSDNYLLIWAVENLHWPWLGSAMSSGYVRGAVSGLGLLNILLGIWEIVNFKETAHAIKADLQREESPSNRV
jgi:hypothetical protein